MLSRFTLLKQLPAGMLAGLAAGALTGFTRLHPEWAPLQIPALALLGWELSREKSFWGGLRPGFWFGIALAGVALAKIRVDLASTVILFVALTAYWTFLGAGLSHFLRARTWRGVAAAAGLLTLGEWAQIYVLPLFGTAQRIAAAWVDSPAMLPFSWLGGTVLVTFVVVGLSLASNRIREGAERHLAGVLFVLAAMGAVFVGNVVMAPYKPVWTDVVVAVCGAKNGESAFLPPALFEKKYLPMVEQAARQGARFVVTPELALDVTPETRDAALARFANDARRLDIVWVLGFSEGGRARPGSLNRSVILNADRPVGRVYDKTHWVDFMEKYAAVGDAKPPVTEARGIRVGTMICQDDNFEDVARNLSLAGARIVGVPTWDWPGVADAHLDSARNRPREFGFVSARAALGGVSAIIAPSGRILASRNHLTDGDGMALATVEVGPGGPTVFARFGDWPTLAVAVAAVLAGLIPGGRQGRKTDPAVA